MKKYDIDTQLKKEGIKALKIWNGAMVGSLVLIGVGFAGMAIVAAKAKLDADKRADDPSEFTEWIKNQVNDATHTHVKMEDLEKENDDIIEDDDE